MSVLRRRVENPREKLGKKRIFKGLFVNVPGIEDTFFSARESLKTLVGHVSDFASVVERFDGGWGGGAAMIFPIQPPLTERDDKAATVIIAVVYRARWPRVCGHGRISELSPLSPLFLTFFSRRRRSRFFFFFFFPPPPSPSLSRLRRRSGASENIFVVPQIAPEATSP